MCFLLTFGDARGLGLCSSVCACVVGLGGHRLLWMRVTWGVVGRSAHVPTIPITWLRRGNAWDWTAHAPTCTQALRGTVNKTMPRMWIHLLCVWCFFFFYGVTWLGCPNMGIATSPWSRGLYARFWLVETTFAALWLVRTYCSLHHYWYGEARSLATAWPVYF